MQTSEAFRWSNISATSQPSSPIGAGNLNSSPPSWHILGGLYSLALVAATYGTVQLQQVGPDGTTLLPVGSAVTANGVQNLYLCPGSYVLAITGATGVYATLTLVPNNI